MNAWMSILFSATMLAGLTVTVGCQNLKPADASKEPATVVAPATVTKPAQDSLSAWLEKAEAPKQVECSVDRDVAPFAVDRFAEISKQIASIYDSVYQEAQEAAIARNSGDVMGDAVLAKVAEGVSTTPGTDWKAAAQQAVISNYQATLSTIDAQRKALLDYTSSLPTDTTIAGLTNTIERTSILLKIGKDATQLGEQLKAAGEGATAIRMRRISTALGK